MELSFAFLANMADHLADGRMIVIGPDFDTMSCPQFPIVVPVALVVKMKVAPEEVGQPHTIKVDYQKPDGTRESLGVDTPIETIINQNDPTKASGASIVVNAGLLAETAGDYVFHIFVDGLEVKSLPMTVKLHGTVGQIVRRLQ